MLGSVSLSQVVLGILWPALVSLEKMLITDMNLQNTVVEATNSVFAVLLVIFRKPSTQGGTVTSAATIAPGTTSIVSSDVPSKDVLKK